MILECSIPLSSINVISVVGKNLEEVMMRAWARQNAHSRTDPNATNKRLHVKLNTMIWSTWIEVARNVARERWGGDAESIKHSLLSGISAVWCLMCFMTMNTSIT